MKKSSLKMLFSVKQETFFWPFVSLKKHIMFYNMSHKYVLAFIWNHLQEDTTWFLMVIRWQTKKTEPDSRYINATNFATTSLEGMGSILNLALKSPLITHSTKVEGCSYWNKPIQLILYWISCFCLIRNTNRFFFKNYIFKKIIKYM